MVTRAKQKTEKPNRPFSARLDETRLRMLGELAKKNGASRSSIASIAITQMYERECPGRKPQLK